MRLAEIQGLFWRMIAAPEGVARALEESRASGSGDAEAVEEVFAGDERMSAAERLDLYANMYFFRLKDALREDVPRTAAALGEARWHNLVTDYLIAHPSRHWSLRWAGQQLPAFLRSHPYGRDLPWLADLALLEWSHADALQAVDVPQLGPDDLAAVEPERWPLLRFVPVPGARLLDLSWDVLAAWDALGELEEGKADELPEVAEREVAVLVWREGFDARHEEVAAAEVPAVRLLLGAQPFAEVCEACGGPDEEPEAAAQKAVGLLARLVAGGVLAREGPGAG